MNSIISALVNWAKQNSVTLSGRGVRLTEKFPDQNSTHPWKASIALAYNGIVVSYTVWERTVFQTELIVMNTLTGKTIVMDEGTPNDPSTIDADLDQVAQKLLSGAYSRARPDPKLIIS